MGVDLEEAHMSYTPAEVIEQLGLTGRGAIAAINELNKRDMNVVEARKVYDKFAGDNPPPLADRLLAVTVNYMVQSALMTGQVDVQFCIERAEKLALAMPSSFTDAANSERAALRAKAREERAAKLAITVAEKAERAAVREVVNPDGTVSRKRGRPPSGVKTAYEQAKDLYVSAVDKSKEAVIAMLQSTLSLGFGTAQTYYYKAKKETPAATP
jgi:hypothetical protein